VTSPGARYSAGTAILDVVPVFEGVQDKIRQHVREIERALGKDAGNELGKGIEEGASRGVDRALGTSAQKEIEKKGREAGTKYAGAFSDAIKKGTRAAQREVRSTIKLVGDDKDLKRNLREVEARLKALNNAKIGIDIKAADALREIEQVRIALSILNEHAKGADLEVNTAQAHKAIAAVEKRLAEMRDVEVEIHVDQTKIGATARAIRKQLEAAVSKLPDIEFDADVTPAQNAIQRLRAQMLALRDKKIGIDIGATEALAEMNRLRTALALLATNKTIDVQVRSDAAQAAKDLLQIKTLAELVDKTRVDIKVDVDRSALSRIQQLRNGLLGAGADGRSGADGFRAFNAMVLAGSAILPAAVPLIAALAGGLALIGPLAVGAGAGLAVLAIGFSGISEAAKALGKSQEQAGKDAEAAAKRNRAAARSVGDAQRAVDRAREASGTAAASAARAVEDAVEQQADAEEALADAQKDVQRAQEDLTRAREEAAEQLEDLNLQVRGGVLSERDAVLDLREAEKDLREGRSEGATGDDLERLILKVDQAKLRLDQARESNEDLRLESEEWARTGVEGSDRVIAAQERVAAAQSGVADAQDTVRDAARGVQDALAAQRQTAADSARAIEDAQRNLIQAQEDYTTAVNETSASQQALEIAMGKLGPAGQEFARFINEMMPQLRDMRDLVQENMLPGVQDMLTSILTENGPLIREFLGDMGTTIGDLFREFGDLMTSPQWQEIWRVFNEYAPIFMRQFGEMAMAMLTFFGELFVALAPYAERFGDALIRAAEGAAAWAAGLKDSEGFREVMEWLFIYGPQIWADIKDILGGLGALFVALLPYGMAVLDVLASIGRFLADMDPAVLGILVALLFAMVVAFQVAAGIVAFLAGGFAILTVQIAAVVFAVLAVGAALVALYLYSEDFREVMDVVFRAIGDLFAWVWERVIKPAFDAFMEAWPDLWRQIQSIWELLQPLFIVIGAALAAAFGVWVSFLSGALQMIAPVLSGIMRAFEGFLQFIQGFVDFFAGLVTGDWSRMWGGLEDIVGGFLGIIWGLIEAVFGGIISFVAGFVETIIDFFAWLYDVLVGHSIVPDLMNAIVWWFDFLFGAVIGLVRLLVNGAIELFTWLWDVAVVLFEVGRAVVVAVFEAIVWAWQNILEPAFRAIATVIGWLWENILMPIFGFIGDAWNVLLTAMKWAWDNILHPMFDVFWAVAEALFAFLTVVIFAPLLIAWELLSAGIALAWNNVIKPTWDALTTAAGWLWNNVLSPIFTAIADGWRLMADGLRWIYDNVIKPWVIDPFVTLIEGLKGAFELAVDGIKTAWELLQNALARPINFVIEMVLNRGLFGAFNWIVDKLGLPDDWTLHWDQIGPPETHFAAGGRVPGWSPNDKADNIPAMLTAGEYVHPVDSVRYYGADAMEAIRKRKIPREVLTGGVHDPSHESTRNYAVGGFVLPRRREDQHLALYQASPTEIVVPQAAASGEQLFNVIKGVFPRARKNSTLRPGANDYHGRGMAVDLGEEGFAGGNGRQYLADMNRWIHDTFGAQTTELIYTGLGDDRPDLKNGRPLNYGAATNNQHRNHVHWAMAGPIIAEGLPGGTSGGGGGGDNWGGSEGASNVFEWAWNGISAGAEWAWNGITGAAEWLWNTLTGPLDHLKNSIIDPLFNFGGQFGDNILTKVVGGIPGHAVDAAWEGIKGVAGAIWNAIIGSGSANGDLNNLLGSPNDPGTLPGGRDGVVAAVRDTVRAMRPEWADGSQWNAISWIINKESGWDPTAQNPTSTASGLFQHVNGTWNSHKPAGERATRMRDATVDAQTLGGLNYFERRYGDPLAAKRHWEAEGWYSEGGPVEEGGGAEAPTLYDTGGWLPPGITTVLNASNKPEPVLTSGMWDELVAARGDDSYDDSNGGIRDLHLHEVHADLSEAIDKVNHVSRVLKRGGRYVGAGTGS